MKKFIFILLVLLVFTLQEKAHATYTGDDLNNDCEDNSDHFSLGFCYGFITAIFQSETKTQIFKIAVNPTTNAQGKILDTGKCWLEKTKDVIKEQVVSIVRKHLKENPEYWRLDAASNVKMAIYNAFPIPDKHNCFEYVE